MESRLKMDFKEEPALQFVQTCENDESETSRKQIWNGNPHDEEPTSSDGEKSSFFVDYDGDKQGADSDKRFEDMDIQSSSTSGNSSQTTIFDLLPETWDESILPLLSLADFQLLINASPEFRQMFMVNSMTCKRLLPLVLPILLKHWTVSKDSILVWRKVSKECQRVVDGELEGATSPKQYYDDHTKKHLEWSPQVVDTNQHWREEISKIQKPYDFRVRSTLTNFTKSFLPASILGGETASRESSSPSPIITKCVELLLPWYDVYRLPVNMILTNYGATLASVSFKVLHASSNELVSAISHLVNVRVLKIHGLMDIHFLAEPQLVQVPRFELARLELLDVGELNIVQEPREQNEEVLSAILGRCGPQLTRLICSSQFFERERTVELLTSGQLPNIRFLSITKAEWATLEILRRLSALPLEDVQLRHVLKDILIREVVEALNTFAPNLTHFQLCDSNVSFLRGDVDDNRNHVSYPKLIKFSTDVSHLTSCYFWPVVQRQFENLKELYLYGATHSCESIEAIVAAVMNNEPILHLDNSYSYNLNEMKRGFSMLAKLEKIVVFAGYSYNANPARENASRVEIYRDGTIKKFKFSRILDANSASQ